MCVASWNDYDEGYLRAYQWAGALAGGAALPQEPVPVALGPGETAHLHLSPVSLHGYFGQTPSTGGRSSCSGARSASR